MNQEGLQKIIKRMGSVSELAKRMGLRRETVSAWLNRNVAMPLERALQMEHLVGAEVTWQELVSPQIVRLLRHCNVPIANSSYVFESVYVSIARIKSSSPELNPTAIHALLQAIQQEGLQHPICIDNDNDLIFGAKRLQAYGLLRKKTIPAWRLSLSDLLKGHYNLETLQQFFSISDRVAIAIAIENKLGKRKGQRTDLLPRQNVDVVIGRTDSLLASVLGFGNRQTYQHAKKIVRSGNLELIEAIDKNTLSVSAAYLLLKSLSEPTQPASSILNKGATSRGQNQNY